MPNIALDLIGQARALYQHAAEIEGQGRDEDGLAYLRREREYLNCLMVERPNGDFAHTMVRQFWFAVLMHAFWQAASNSSDATLAGIAQKAVKEVAYHVRHTGEWVIRLGDGTAESARRTREAVLALAPYLDELFEEDEVTRAVAAAGIAPDPTSLRPTFDATVARVFGEAFLEMPPVAWPQSGGRSGRHSEAMGYLLAELQHMQRTYPGAKW